MKSIFVGCIDFSYMWGDVSQELRQLGFDVTYLGGYSHPSFAYKHKLPASRLIRLIEHCYALRNQTGRVKVSNLHLKVTAVIGSSMLKLILFTQLLMKRTDYYIFVAGSSLLPYHIDVIILNAFKVPTISFIGHGGDSRPLFLDGNLILTQDLKGQDDLIKIVRRRSKKLSKNIKRVTKTRYVICNPAHSQFVKRGFYSLHDFFDCMVFKRDIDNGMAVEPIKKDKSVRSFTHERPLRIIHTFSSPVAKGTNEIDRVAQSLRAKGYPIEIQIRSGLPHPEAIKIRAEADVCIDQLYGDVPLSSSATEALSVGVPVIVGGYEILDLPGVKIDTLPGFFIRPDQLEQTLIRIIEDPTLISIQHGKIREFNLEDHVNTSAKRIVELLEGRSQFNTYDPSTLPFYHGMGINENTLRTFLKTYVGKYGIKGMFVNEHSRFVRSIYNFIDNVN